MLNPSDSAWNKNRGHFVPPHDGKDPVKHPGGGSWDQVDLLVIGWYPAEDEEEAQEPMVGPSTFDWRRAITEYKRIAGVRRVRKLNVCNCRTTAPGKTKRRINRDPTAAEMKACASRWLVPELRSAPDDVSIVTLGGNAYDFTFGVKHHGKFKDSRGNRVLRGKLMPKDLADRLEARLKGTIKKKANNLNWRHCACGRILKKGKKKCVKCRKPSSTKKSV